MGKDTVSRIGKPDMSIRMNNSIVGGIEAFALEGVYEDSNRSVIFGTCDTSCAVFTTDKPTLPIARMSIGVVSGFAINAHHARGFLPFQNTVVWNITPKEVSTITEPDGSLCPTRSRPESFYDSISDFVFRETWVNDFNRWIGITRNRFPIYGWVCPSHEGSHRFQPR